MVATGCKAEFSIGSNSLDVSALEDAIEQELFGDGRDQGKSYTPIECPDDPDDEVGSVFICTTTYAGEDLTVRVTVDEDGADFIREQAIIDMDKARTVLTQFLVDQTGVTATDVDCPEQTVYLPGEAFICTATAPDGDTLDLEIIVRDIEGNIDLSPVNG